MSQVDVRFNKLADCLTVNLPLSKSISARQLVCTFWRGGELSSLETADCDDSRELKEALQALQGALEEEEDTLKVYLGRGAASLRFFLPVAASVSGANIEVDYDASLARRPIKELVEVLEGQGVVFEWQSGFLKPPFIIHGIEIRGGRIEMAVDRSSQFVSALMLSAPVWKEGVSIKYDNSKVVSRPYIEMTAAVMRKMGASARVMESGVEVSPGGYEGGITGEKMVERDWSAAAFFYELLLICGEGHISLPDLTPPDRSIQGDARCAALFRDLGVLSEWGEYGTSLHVDRSILEYWRNSGKIYEVNLSETPDLVPSLAVGCCVAGIHFKFTGIGNLKYKECDRLGALQMELLKLGYSVKVNGMEMEWDGKTVEREGCVSIRTYSDHRMAMAFAMAAVRDGHLQIEEGEVVGKSFAGFWKEIEKLGFSVSYI